MRVSFNVYIDGLQILKSKKKLLSFSDDCQIVKWTTTNRDFVQVAKIPDFKIPTDFNWLIAKSGKVSLL